jgi:hypothetical protein
MLQRKISGLPVVNDLENIVGVVSESDFLRRTEIGTKRQRSRWVEFFMGPGWLADEYVQFAGRKIGDVYDTRCADSGSQHAASRYRAPHGTPPYSEGSGRRR